MPEKREPIFGTGAPSAIAWLVGWLLTFSVIYYFVHRQPEPKLAPGESTIIDGVKIKRIN